MPLSFAHVANLLTVSLHFLSAISLSSSCNLWHVRSDMSVTAGSEVAPSGHFIQNNGYQEILHDSRDSYSRLDFTLRLDNTLLTCSALLLHFKRSSLPPSLTVAIVH